MAQRLLNSQAELIRMDAAKLRERIETNIQNLEREPRPTHRRAQQLLSRLRETLAHDRIYGRMIAVADALEHDEMPVALSGKKIGARAITVIAPSPTYPTDPTGRNLMAKAGIHDAGTYEYVYRAIDSMVGPDRMLSVRDARKIQLRLEIAGRSFPGFFPTPERVIDEMIYLLDQDKTSFTVLEPCAGDGAICDRLINHFDETRIGIVACELQYELREITKAKGYTAPEQYPVDFLAWNPDEIAARFDYVIMNPPFEKGQDIQFIRHAHKFLAVGGQLVSVIPMGTTTSARKGFVEFKAWAAAQQGEDEVIFHELPSGSFKEAGTGIETALILIPKPMP